MKPLFFIALVACGGVHSSDDAGTDAHPACYATEWGACVYCVDGADAGTFGNIARVNDDGTIEYGGCISPPICSKGACVE